MKRYWLALIFGCAGQWASAQGLFHDSCVNTAAAGGSEIVVVAYRAGAPAMMGLRCEDLKRYTEAVEMIGLALYPATLAMTRSPEVFAALAEMGLTMANPAVLGVTVLGATGAVVFYIVLKKTMDECEQYEKEQLRRSILKEMELRYGLKGPHVQLEVKR